MTNNPIADKLENYMLLVQRTMTDDNFEFEDNPGHIVGFRRKTSRSTLFGGTGPWPYITRYLPIFSLEYRYEVETRGFVGEGQLKHGSFVRVKTDNKTNIVQMNGPSLTGFFGLPQSLITLLFFGKYEDKNYRRTYSYTKELYDEDIWYVWRLVISDIRTGKLVIK
jgi:hypothetical protein